MRRLLAHVALFCIAVSSQLVSQQQSPKMTNADVIQLLSMGLSADVIVEKINSSSTEFDTSIQALKVLKDNSVPDAVIKAMINPGGNTATGKTKDGRIRDELTTAYQKWQNSVFTVWSELGRGTGFLFDNSGLILTNQHVIGPSEYVAVQFDAKRKVQAKVLASDAQKDVAVLWANLKDMPEAIPAPLGLHSELNAAVVEGERVFTIGSPLHQRKVLTTGVVSKVEPKAIISDININHGNSGGPLFNSLGIVVGITTFGDLTRAGGPGISGILRIEEAASLIEAARTKATPANKPSAGALPVEPTDTFPLEAIKSALLIDKFDVKPYAFGVGDYDVAVITPILKYYFEREAEMRAAKEKDKRNRKHVNAVQGSFRPLDDLKNWEEYVGEYQPVILVRATPKLRETTGSIFLRSFAAAGGAYGVPAKLRFKTDFYRMKLKCGDAEIMPINPGKIAHVIDLKSGLINATDATYEGLYVYPADAIAPSCGRVTLELFSEKEPETPKSKVLDEKSVTRVWADFEPYRQPHPSN